MAEDEDAARQPDPQPPDVDLVDPLAPWARTLSLVFGVGATGFGGYAVLASDNQAGTAFILLTGAVLLLMGLQGTPLRRLGSGEHSLELAAIRRERRALSIVAEVTREQPPEIAAAVIEVVDAIDSPIAMGAANRGSMYEVEVEKAIVRIGARSEASFVPIFGDPGFDLSVQLPSGRVNIDVRYRSRGSLTTYDVMYANEKIPPDAVGGYLLVTNAPISPQLRRYNSKSSPESNLFEIIQWASPADDDVLHRALVRKAR
jgi:hypothetical protein